MTSSRSARRIAIIGAGPRGLWAVEELLERARVPLDVTVFDPYPAGAGAVYRPQQPLQWRLNVNCAIVTTAHDSFNAWRTRRGEDTTDAFPPRVQVGQFLADTWSAAVRRAPSHVRIRHLPHRVSEVSNDGEGFVVDGASFDDVLVCTGHDHLHAGSLVHEASRVPVTGLYFGADLPSAPRRIGVRGAALSFIDVCLLYGDTAEVIYPVSRSGRFMEVKPSPETPLPEVATRWRQACAHITNAADLREILIGAAAEFGDFSRGELAAVIDGQDFTGDAVAELEASLRAAEGTGPLTPAAAVGAAFRGVFQDCVDWHKAHGPMPGFRELSRTLERVAFGPPPVTAKRLLELIHSGVVNTHYLGTPEQIDSWRENGGVDLLIDATVAPQATHSPFHDVPGVVEIGRMNEISLPGHDSLNRSVHDDIPRWAEKSSKPMTTTPVEPLPVHGTVPLRARWERWMRELVENPQHVSALTSRYGSPVNVLNLAPLRHNAQELLDAGASHGVETQVFFARKANKALCFVDAARNAGLGVDVASENELRQVLDRGVAPERIILSAAVKTNGLLRLAVSRGVTISCDSRAESRRIAAIARDLDTIAHVAPRLAPDPNSLPPTRFGERLPAWRQAEWPKELRVVGVHVHLHGYSEADRRTALAEAIALVEHLRTLGQPASFIDIGGGVPMSYLDSREQWKNYLERIASQRAGTGEPFTWKSDPLSNTYPFWQEPTRGQWLDQLLSGEVPGYGTAGKELRKRNIALHLEPGRSLLDGCGVILTEVSFLKERSDGLPLIGVAMNRTQCRTAADDILLDPLLVPTAGPVKEISREPRTGFVVGAYCIEDEVILRRELDFPAGIAVGDTLAIPNTAGYFMHILESASHQIPLARNVYYDGGEWKPDDIDAV